MSLEGEEKPLKDEELEMVVQVIRRGLMVGNQLEILEEKLARSATILQECKRRLLKLERIANEIGKQFQRCIDPQRKQPITMAEAVERVKWIHEKKTEAKEQLE